MGQAPHGPVQRVPPAQQGQHSWQSLFGMGHLRTGGLAGQGGPRSAPRCAKGQREENSPHPPSQVIPYRCLQAQGDFHLSQDGFGRRIRGEHAAACSCVTPCLRHPARPCGTKPSVSPPGPALPHLPRGPMPSCPGRCSHIGQGPGRRGGRRARPRRPRSPGVLGAGTAPAPRGAEEGSAGCSILLLMPEGLPQTIRVCSGIKGGLWPRCPAFGAVSAGWERLCGAGGTVPGRSHGGALAKGARRAPVPAPDKTRKPCRRLPGNRSASGAENFHREPSGPAARPAPAAPPHRLPAPRPGPAAHPAPAAGQAPGAAGAHGRVRAPRGEVTAGSGPGDVAVAAVVSWGGSGRCHPSACPAGSLSVNGSRILASFGDVGEVHPEADFIVKLCALALGLISHTPERWDVPERSGTHGGDTGPAPSLAPAPRSHRRDTLPPGTDTPHGLFLASQPPGWTTRVPPARPGPAAPPRGQEQTGSVPT